MFWARIAENRRRTQILFAAFMGLVAAVAWAVHFLLQTWSIPAVIALVATGIAIGALWLDQWLLLALVQPREATADEHQQLMNVLDEMAIAAQVPTPRCLVIETDHPNAFACGTPGKSVICVTSGLLRKLNRDELAGVLAHEMAHIANHDTRVMTVAFVLAGIITMVCDLSVRMGWLGASRRDTEKEEKRSGDGLKMVVAILITVLAPLAAKLLTMAVSRQREFLADAEATRLTRNPQGLASALRKIVDDTTPFDRAVVSTAHLYIVSPVREGRFASDWFATHPPIEERIARLQAM